MPDRVPPLAPRRSSLDWLANAAGRSLFPLATLAILAGTLAWGPWVSLVLALVTWRLVVRHA